MSQYSIKIFCDFDGTVATTDIGNKFYREFGNPEKCDEIVSLWKERLITSSECLSRECETITNLNEERLMTFISKQKIDPSFKTFVDFCEVNNIQIFVVSDGIEIYIKELFKKNFINIPYFSNKLEIHEDGTAEMLYPYSDNSCNMCANCKRNHVINQSSDDEISIYIGDGHSDFCPIEFCDYIFAKDQLMLNCQKNKIPFFPFSDFDEILSLLKKLTQKKRLKKRNQAVLKRKELYTLEA